MRSIICISRCFCSSSRLHFVLLFLAVAVAAPVFAQPDDTAWVRVHHPADSLTVRGMEVTAGGLRDYGGFQWGRLTRSQITELQSAGLTVSVTDNPFVLHLGGESFDPLDQAVLDERFQPYQADPGGDWHLVQFDGPVRQEWLQALRATGLQVAQPLHPFSYFVWGTNTQISTARSLQAVRWSGAMQPEWKVQPHLRSFAREARPTMALASAHVDRGRLRRDLSQFGQVHEISPLNRHFQIVHMDAPGDLYASIGELPAIYTVQYISQDAGPRGEMSNQSVVGNINGSGAVFPGYADWLNVTGFDGNGVIVGIVDGGTNIDHVDLADNIVPCLGTEGSCGGAGSGHGTHVAGGVAGTGVSGVTNGAGFLRGQGVAPGASLVVQRYNPFVGAGPGGMIPNGMLRIYKDSAESGALLTNNSWGPTTTPQGYDIPTKQIDFISRDALPDVPGHQPVLAVWSIMNGDGDSGGACAPASHASPDEAKNLFAVGSTSLQTTGGAQEGNIFRVSPNSAHGPACDGRQLPHIVAPGCRTDSTAAATGTTGWGLSCGTSMASPVVSGAVAVWAEQYIQQTGTNPSPALVKAVFTAAARDLVGNPNADGGTMGHRPDRFQGFGRLDLDQVMNHGLELFTLDQAEVFTSVGEDWSIGLSAVDPEQPIRIMLAWTDAPGHGLGGSTPAWVNDLDLAVEAGGNTYLGNVIGSDGWSATGGIPDSRNNLEGVFLNPSQHQGAVNVTVTAASLQGDALNPYDPTINRQDFALACYNCVVDAGFHVNLAPSTGEVCLPDAGLEALPVTVSVAALGGYSGSVSLSTSGEPIGVSSEVDPASVLVPGSAEWTLSVDHTAAAGSYLISMIGDDGDEAKSGEFTLNLDEQLAAGPGLLMPADGAGDLTLSPIFDWSMQPGAADYRLQVALDADFETIVIDEVLAEPGFVPEAELAIGTEYFWRVGASNLCGPGDWSATFSFTTRLEPVAGFSAESFTLELPQNRSGEVELVISNLGTGNLVWSVATDQITAGQATNRFTGAFDPDNWELVNSPTAVNGSVVVDAGPPGEVRLTGGNAGTGGITDFQIEIPAAGTIHFDWGYQSNDISDFDSGGFAIDGSYTELADNVSQVPNFHQAHSLEVAAGELFAFRVNTVDGLFGPGVLGVTNFIFEPIPCSAELSAVPWLSATPDSGSVVADGTQIVTITVDAAGLDEGSYEGYLCISTNDPENALVKISVSLRVPDSGIFQDRFQDDPSVDN